MTGDRDVGATFLPDAATLYETLPPCRVVDTRGAVGPLGGPALAAGETRSFLLAGACGVPADAVALSLNVTAAEATAAGSLTLYPGRGPAPGTNTVSYATGRTRANNAILALVDGRLSALVNQPSGTVHLVVDVNGFFR
jgi:hypothetical protein